MGKKRIETWLLVGVLGIGGLIVFIGGLFAYVVATARPIHPAAGDVPSTEMSAPAPRWAGAVERARQLVRDRLAEQNLPGVSVAVGVDDAIVWAEGFGFADLDSRAPVAPDMRFRIGTASIALTSAGVGLLLEDGRLKLDEPIRTYVPEYPQKEWPVTLRELLSHTGGVRTDAGDEGPYGEHCDTTLEGLTLFADRSLLFEPGTRYRFSTFGWILVSAAIERASGEPFLTFMQERVFDPIGMRDTRAESSTELVRDRATPYFPRFAADPRYGPDPMREIDLSCYAGAGVFLSTPSDLVRFGLAMSRGSLLQPDTVRLLQTSARLPSGGETGYGLGWDLETVDLAGEQVRTVGHDGDVLGGPAASLWTFPNGVVVAVTSNISWADTAGLAARIAEVFETTGADRPGR